MTHGGYAFAIFSAPLLLSALADFGLALASERIERRKLIFASLLGVVGGLGLCALATSPWLISVGLALAGAASGGASGAAQVELIGLEGDAERALARWTVFAALGDVVAPLLVTASIGLGASYHGALWAVSLLLIVQALALRRGRPRAQHPPATSDAAPALPLRQALRRCLREPRLWLWLAGTASCALLDEIVVALAALHAQRDLGASEAVAAGCLTAFSLGAVLGALLTDAAVCRFGGRRTLIASSAVSLLALGLTLAAPSVTWLGLALFVLGASAAPHYPLAQARAYAVVPASPGLVNAAAQAFVVFEVVAPLALGAIAEGLSLELALACLALQPVTLIVLALSVTPAPSTRV